MSKQPVLTSFQEVYAWTKDVEDNCNVMVYQEHCQRRAVEALQVACRSLFHDGNMAALGDVAAALAIEGYERPEMVEQFSLKNDCGHPYECCGEDDSCLWCADLARLSGELEAKS